MIKAIVLTRHAIVKMEERKIRFAWVEDAIRNPLWTEPEPRDTTAERRFARIGDHGGRMLRVVCVETDDTIRVITATFDRGARNPK
ncbi:DUF4258 domain-containing protein [Aquamicrobium sp. LC103]|uniref:DUF4258 domain-containing protein n=1 Tax=Aquamicrobium sp. LC103 TaxID=1120658 RepID=UPI00069C35FE|nr:DUF4258 domain-containing protein [Aquamicrobium sp. LC103]TKT74861.1 DUF4258 domain-containing protein [Aquamicrobium sp. LC103]